MNEEIALINASTSCGSMLHMLKSWSDFSREVKPCTAEVYQPETPRILSTQQKVSDWKADFASCLPAKALVCSRSIFMCLRINGRCSKKCLPFFLHHPYQAWTIWRPYERTCGADTSLWKTVETAGGRYASIKDMHRIRTAQMVPRTWPVDHPYFPSCWVYGEKLF